MIPVLSFFGDDAEFHHIGIAVNSIKNLCPESQVFKDEIQKVSVAFVSINGINTELIEPLNERSPITQSLRKGIKLVHICYETPRFEKALKGCRKHGFHCISNPAPATAFDNRRIAWVYSKHYGLFELLEK